VPDAGAVYVITLMTGYNSAISQPLPVSHQLPQLAPRWE
jgi:hypothetical protein